MGVKAETLRIIGRKKWRYFIPGLEMVENRYWTCTGEDQGEFPSFSPSQKTASNSRIAHGAFVWSYTGQCLRDSLTPSPVDKYRPRASIFSSKQEMGLLGYLGGDGVEPTPLDQRRDKWNHFVTVLLI